jgi:dTDP-4-amino-4,6-dideoxygalactose transaminase
MQRRLHFGHNGPLDFHGLGINGKISELQAAFGLSILPYMEQIIAARKQVVQTYYALMDFSRIQKLSIRPGTALSYSYYPIIFESEQAQISTQEKLNAKDIYPCRYFYPALHQLPYVQSAVLPVA